MQSAVIPRRIEPIVSELMSGFRVVIVNGPRQSGKSTLLQLVHAQRGGTSVTLDDRDVQRVARTDPQGFVTGFEHPMFIDEIQRGGDPLVIAVKADVDRHHTETGRYVLAGSSRFLTVPGLTESLAGRAAIVELWPLSQGELHGGSDDLLDRLFGSTDDLRATEPEVLSRHDIADRIVRGGFPTPVSMGSQRVRESWFVSYLDTILQRDLAQYRQPSRTVDLTRLIQLLLGRTSQEFVAANVSNVMGITGDTVASYAALGETIFLHHFIPGWSGGHTARVIKHPKIHAFDTGVAASVLNTSAAQLSSPLSHNMGALLETFVVNELAKQRTWSEIPARLFHYRDKSGAEVDLIIEARDGRLSAVEVKAAVDVDDDDFRHLRRLRDTLGERFVNGTVIHLGSRPLPFGDRLTALPVSTVWAPHPAK